MSATTGRVADWANEYLPRRRLLATLLICTNAMTSRMLDRARSFDCVAKFLDIDFYFGYKG